MQSLCNHWEFTKEWTDSFMLGEGVFESVRLPHTVAELPLHYADHMVYQMLCGYRRKLNVTAQFFGVCGKFDNVFVTDQQGVFVLFACGF